MTSPHWARTQTYVADAAQREAVAVLLGALDAHEGAAAFYLDSVRHEVPQVVLDALLQVARVLENGRPVTVSEQEHLLTPHESADLLGITRPELDRLLESGELPFQTIGRHHRIALSDVLARRRGSDPTQV